MTDLEKTLAALRDAYTIACLQDWDVDRDAVGKALAALDATRGQAVAWAIDTGVPLPTGEAIAWHETIAHTVPLYAAPPAAAAPPERDWTMIQSGDTSIPAWVVHYANAIGAYMKARHAGYWAVGPVQSREQDPPAAAVSADTERLLFLQKFLLDLGEVEYNIEKGCMCGCCWAFSLSGGGIDVEGETLEQAIDRAMLAAAERKGVES